MDTPLLDLLRAHQDAVYTICLNVLRHPQDAEDAAQEALLEVAAGIDRLREERAFRSWLYRLTYRTALDHLRKRRAYVQAKARRTAMGEPDARLPEEDRTALHQAIDALPDDERMAVVEHYFEKATLDEVGAREGISGVAIWKRLDRARERIRLALSSAGFGVAAAQVAEALESMKPAAAPAGLIGKSITSATALAAMGGIAMGTKTTVSAATLAVAGLCLLLGGAGGVAISQKRATASAQRVRNEEAETLRRELATARAELDKARKTGRSELAPAAAIEIAPAPESPRPPAGESPDAPKTTATREAEFEARVRSVDWPKHVRALKAYWAELEKARVEGRPPRIGPELGMALSGINTMAAELAAILGLPSDRMMEVYDHPAAERAWTGAMLGELAGASLTETQLAQLRKTSLFAEEGGESRDGGMIDAWIGGLHHNLDLVRETKGILTPDQHAALQKSVTPSFMLSVYMGYTEKPVAADAASVTRHWMDAWSLPQEQRPAVEAVAADYLANWTALQQASAGTSRESEIEKRLRELELQKAAEERLAQSLTVDEETQKKILKLSSGAMKLQAR